MSMEKPLESLTIDATGGPAQGNLKLWHRLLLSIAGRIECGRLTLIFPDGARHVVSGPAPGHHGVLRVRSDRAIRRLLLGGDTGLAEAYMAGEWDSPNLSDLLRLGAQNIRALDNDISAGFWARLRDRLRHMRNANTRSGSRRNIAYHYDLGNAFYQSWLDPTMTYSSALFPDRGASLESAQRAKYRRLADTLEIRPHEKVLEVGCGWGGFAEVAASDYGAQVVGLTLSQEQAHYAYQRLAPFGERVSIRLEDYRDTRGEYDKIASIEMSEAVGEANWPVYFRKLAALIRSGGRIGIQAITIDESRFEAYRREPDFIQKYVFPGGMLPSPRRFEEAALAAGLRIADKYVFGTHYAETLRRWNAAFQANWNRIEKLGFDQRFRRMWSYYLAYCEAGFDAGTIDVGQYVLVRP